MAVSTFDQIGRLLRGRELQFRAVVITALCSYGAQLIGILLHWELAAIAAVTIIPWIPLISMKVFWTSKHYGFMAVYFVIMLLQAGHVMEHVVQMLQFIFIYDPQAGCYGWSWHGYCSLAHGVFGELNREVVHFVWDGLILVACVVLRIHFRKSKNIWLTLAVIAATIHQIEHIYLYGNYALNPAFYNNGGYFLGIHIVNGLAAQNGILGYNGIVGTLFPFINPILPTRINLHFIYNVCVFIPMVLAFRQEVRKIYDEWLAKALPELSEEQLIAATAQSQNERFAPGQVIFRQGDLADKFYIITEGQVDITRAAKNGGPEMSVGRLSQGQFFGEIELLGKAERAVTARAVGPVECLTLNRDVLKEMLASSSEAYKGVDVLLRRRLVQLGALQGLSVQDTVNADPDTVLKTRMIRERLKALSADDVSRILGRAPAGVAPAVGTLGQPNVAPQFNVGAAGTAVAERPAPAPVPIPSAGFRRGALLVRSGPSAGMRYEITTPRIVVGRRSADPASSSMDVPIMQIDDARISRYHVEIFARPDGLYVRDMGSANGSWLNGRQLGGEPVRLQDGAEIQVGPDTMLSFRVN
jgi:CRP-like cAMP-binding protein